MKVEKECSEKEKSEGFLSVDSGSGSLHQGGASTARQPSRAPANGCWAAVGAMLAALCNRAPVVPPRRKAPRMLPSGGCGRAVQLMLWALLTSLQGAAPTEPLLCAVQRGGGQRNRLLFVREPGFAEPVKPTETVAGRRGHDAGIPVRHSWAGKIFITENGQNRTVPVTIDWHRLTRL